MRLRDISDRLREIMERDPEGLLGPDTLHALVQDISDPQILYRPIVPLNKKDANHPWLAFAFEPFSGLVEPFNIHPGRMWALLRMHKQSSGLPELVVSIMRELPGTSTPIEPAFEVSFSQSPRVETIIKKTSKDPAELRVFHKGGLPDRQRNLLPRDLCLPGFEPALPAGDIDDHIPGLVDLDGVQHLFVGRLVFYNNYRTPDRGKLKGFLLNAVSCAVVARYVRNMVQKTMAEAG